jgi:hypothetical protein
VVLGRHVLATMVPSDAALLLISMQSCNTGVEHESREVRGFALVPYHDGAPYESLPESAGSRSFPMTPAARAGGTRDETSEEHVLVVARAPV